MNDNIDELKVINENINESKVFKSVEEFNLFYQINIEKMKKQTTNYLNKIYKIITNDGNEYKIIKRNCTDNKRMNGDIYLKKVGNSIIKLLEEHINKLPNVVDQQSKVIDEYLLNVLLLTTTE